jgi:hypothetical protein
MELQVLLQEDILPEAEEEQITQEVQQVILQVVQEAVDLELPHQQEARQVQ